MFKETTKKDWVQLVLLIVGLFVTGVVFTLLFSYSVPLGWILFTFVVLGGTTLAGFTPFLGWLYKPIFRLFSKRNEV